jgi:ATP-binding cassette subfamily F protein 3
MRAEQLALQQAAFAKQQDKIAHLQKFIDRFKAKASKAKQAQSRVKALDRMEKLAPRCWPSRLHLRVQGAANLPNPMLAMQRRLFGYPPPEDGPSRTPPPSCATSAAACWPASASASWAPTARASPRWSRPLPATMAPPWRHDDRRQGPEHRLLRPAGAGRAAPDDNPLEHMIRLARDLGANRQGQARREQDLRSFLGSSTSAATWSSRPWAA